MESIADLIKNKGIDIPKGKVSLTRWQLWALDFCKKYGITRKTAEGRNNFGRIMKIAKEHQDSLDYLSYVSGWLSDYPNLGNGNHAMKMLFWKVNKDKKDIEARKQKKDNRIYM